ncbi:flagellar basal-body rod protein FlgG [Paenibacillus baekrokdamisoli]|uniref:Flagellar basal-body rod protein FlgG n=1 Tax=Paenibacillus baekrokdamisoli TaxID=1712516 RepID=A0A3G9JAD8_9BACL|nr:flagellar basal body rod protein FlgG [Paenibacillus baekrokdamisoli]MBB3069778.1 flagellar hook protein FlgE [Paenibacillus baekrokdamisoli]BBH20868.1 flagellar basal-body rod protein FlgG [Paenibacillus baekrokdamisoli]
MLRSMYSGVSGMRGFQTKLDVIGNNIANVNTVGFKAGRVMFKDILSQSVSGVTRPEDGATGGVNAKQIGLGVAVAAIDTIHTPGSAMTTNVPTDLRIDGDGFFVVSPDDGTSKYLTRAGNFGVDALGQLVNGDGMFVLDSGGAPIKLDPAEVKAFSISSDGSIIGVNADGTTQTYGQLGVVKVVNPGGLEKVGGNLYKMTQNANPDGAIEITTPGNAESGTGAIVAGQLEMSNVDLTSEFTEMIVAQRGFQANSRIITTSDEILQEVVNLKR